MSTSSYPNDFAESEVDDRRGWASTSFDSTLSPLDGDAQLRGSGPSDALGDLPTTGRISRYEIKYKLGEGGLGTVHAAHDPLLSRTVAIKTMRVTAPDEERKSLESMLLHEARAAAALNHPYIVTVHDAGLSEQGVYLAMEYLRGSDLRRLLRDGARPGPWQSARIVRRLADALAYAHGKGVVHCDVKPANVLMVGSTHPKLTDFGIARVVGQAVQVQPLPRESKTPLVDMLMPASATVAAGSPPYMAPEQLDGEVVDARCDVYSLGVMLYELLVGRRPYDGGSVTAIQQAVRRGGARAPHEVQPEVPRALSEIAAKAMARLPQERYQTVRAMAQALRQALATQDRAERASAAAPSVDLAELLLDRVRHSTVPGPLSAPDLSDLLAPIPGLDDTNPTPPPRPHRRASGARRAWAWPTLPAWLRAPKLPRLPTLPRLAPPQLPSLPQVPRGVAAAGIAGVSLSVAAVVGWMAWPASGPDDLPAAAPPAPAIGEPPAPAPAQKPSRAERRRAAAPHPSDAAAAGNPVRPDASNGPAPAAAPRAAAAPPAVAPAPDATSPAREANVPAEPVPAREAVPAPAPAPAPQGTGHVQFQFDQPAHVEIDGQAIGQASSGTTWSLPAGTHRLVIRAPGQPPHRTTVTVEPDGTAIVQHRGVP